jgi:hypothetical protein
MVKVIQASLTVVVSIIIAVVVVITVFPVHALGGAAERAAAPGIRHAVLVEYSGAPSHGPAAAPTCPALTRPDSGTTCPYLSSLAARSGCPALSPRSECTSCPFLSGKARPDAKPRVRDEGGLPHALTL